MSSVFNTLKQQTQASHAKLERSYPFSGYQCVEDLSTRTYADILSTMSQFHQSAQTVLAHALTHNTLSKTLVAHANSETIIAALRCDLRSLTTASFDPSSAQHHSDIALPTFHSPLTSCLAALYVWLGSSMGANIILRRLTQLTPSFPTDYYNAMAGASQHWITYKLGVENEFAHLLNDKVFIQQLVDDANSWFAYLISLGSAGRSEPKYCETPAML